MSVKEKKTKRNSSVELFRMLAMFSILLIHTFGHGSGLDYEWIYSLGGNFSTAGHLALFSLGKAGVTCFMFISGYYGIRFSGRKMLNMVFMLTFYIVLCSLLSGNISLGTLVMLMHPWDGWWFVESYMLICVLSPLINAGIDRLTKFQFQWIVLGMVVYSYLGHFITMQNAHDTDLLLTIFMVGRYLAIYPPHRIFRNSLQISVLSMVLLALIPVVIMQLTHNNTLMKLFLNNNNLLLLIFAASTVITLNQRPFYSSHINWLASSTLAIYLITDSRLRSIIDPWLLSYVMENSLIGYALMATVCVACLFIDKVREIMFIPVDRLLDKKLYKKNG